MDLYPRFRGQSLHPSPPYSTLLLHEILIAGIDIDIDIDIDSRYASYIIGCDTFTSSTIIAAFLSPFCILWVLVCFVRVNHHATMLQCYNISCLPPKRVL